MSSDYVTIMPSEQVVTHAIWPRGIQASDDVALMPSDHVACMRLDHAACMPSDHVAFMASDQVTLMPSGHVASLPSDQVACALSGYEAFSGTGIILYESGLLLRFVMLCRFEINRYVTAPTLLLFAFVNL